MTTITNYEQMLKAAAAAGPIPVAIAAAQELEVLIAAAQAQALGIVQAFLVGDLQEIREIARERDLDLSGMQMVDEPDCTTAAHRTMQIVAAGGAKVAIKGQMPTPVFLHAALQRETGLRTGRLVSHVGVFEVPGFDRLLFITDGGVVLFPNKEQKIEIVSNGIAVARSFGVRQPKVALLAAADHVLPELPVTLEIEEIVSLYERWSSEGAVVGGPLLLDTAVSPEIARQRGRGGAVAGHAQVLVAPDVESGNIMAKGITYFAGGRMAGLVVGAKAPLVVGSRADPPETRLVCMAAGALVAAYGLCSQ
ncbi:MAG: phosphate butyryltransferase [Chloroflexi bacterium]|nr:phosphate butyryltransferase [Chloroflexota bacterium]